MQNPLRYQTTPLNGMHVMVVDDGTKITDERTGEEVIVTDASAAAKGNVIYCTKPVFEALKKQTQKSN
jgi:hypothetical protein